MLSILHLAPQFQISTSYWLLAFLAAFLIGISKAGLKGINIINVTIIALVFETKASTGIMLVLLSFADILAVIYYNRHADWKYIKILLPWMLLGILAGSFIGKDLLPATFKQGMAVIIIFSVIMMLWWERKKEKNVPTHWWFGSLMGMAAGITTMLGNLAGAFTNIYFLAMRLPKAAFIGTAAWLFFITNLSKIPLHIFYWKTINVDSLAVNLRLFPIILLGFFVGVKVVSRIKNQDYRKMILVLTAIGAILIFFK
ncbi:MAG: sulfite exporter TauE/SafE family protein [Bacteroidota bacterium]